MTDVADRVSAPLEALVGRFDRMIRRVGRDHGLVDADVDEVLQDVRIRIWRARAESVAQLNASYVHRTAVSAALDLVRRRRRDRTVSFEASPRELSGAPETAADRRAERADLVGQVARAVDALPPSRRPVVRMYLHGYSREEIAQLLGWTEAKTRNLLYRGLADVREALRGAGVGPEGLHD
jgi:RNA polymerase sigma-70 factor (ECF subfamily)